MVVKQANQELCLLLWPKYTVQQLLLRTIVTPNIRTANKHFSNAKLDYRKIGDPYTPQVTLRSKKTEASKKSEIPTYVQAVQQERPEKKKKGELSKSRRRGNKTWAWAESWTRSQNRTQKKHMKTKTKTKSLKRPKTKAKYVSNT